METNVRSYGMRAISRVPVVSRGQRTRGAILDASYSLFVKQGFAATSMRDIAVHSHVALGGIYNHFSSKEAIFRTIIEGRHPLLETIPLLGSAEGDSIESFVRNAAHTLVEQLGHHPDFLNLMLIEIVEFKARHLPKLFEKFLPLVAPLSQRLSSTRGSLRTMPAPVLARAFLGMFFSYYITETILGRSMPPEMSAGAIDHFVDIFLHGILKEARP
jgi:AcrR family transcriptional regulator